MINLFETYNQNSWDLHYSLIMSGYNNPTIAIQDDGFLPEDVTSPYLYFTGFDQVEGRPLYFNQVPVPDFWEITGNNNQAEVHDYHRKRAHIHYATPSHLRQVKAVDWYDDKGRLRVTDRYNNKGYCFAQTSYNQESKPTLTTYFTKDRQEVIVENHTTGDLILNANQEIFIFKNRADFICHYLKTAGYSLDRIFYNSLATPFLVAYRLGQSGQDVLFWQEEITDKVPANMTFLLEGKNSRATKVVIQHKETFLQLEKILPQKQKASLDFLGFHYPFKGQYKTNHDILIMTNSDQLEGLSELVNALPQLTFHIGALTEMSSQLMAFGRYNNVQLYPNIAQSNVNHLFNTCAFYLDINHGSEILSALRAAFENRMLLLTFDETCHNRHYIAPDHCFPATKVSDMIVQLAYLASHPEAMAQAIHKQELAASVATKEEYQAIIT
ncbi:accessory Sec system glycosylation chaperone GtfB [Streptococcus pluranimalium]|uniref:accessory Sec system glycosylation chaperone GtfB n=1 Tax=Streptococcus pluranimalium TaxID=82348 RepID=UPI0039FC8938